MKSVVQRCFSIVIPIILLLGMFFIEIPAHSSAVIMNRDVSGNVYAFPDDNPYEITAATPIGTTAEGAETYGTFTIGGNIAEEGIKNGIPAYRIESGDLLLSYTYSDTLLKAEDPDLQLYSDSENVVNHKELEQDIKKGAIILQTSMDHKNWSDAVVCTNQFEEVPVQRTPFYTTQEIEILNGCYYRVTVAYETRIRINNSKNPFKDHFKYTRHAEVYEFYAYNEETLKKPLPQFKTRLGDRVRVEEYDGYFGSEEIDSNDAHYGWELGEFFVSARPAEKKNNGAPVFLKKEGDQMILWFHLNQNIDGLNNNPNLTITPDKQGYDKYFETPLIDMGRGTLVIRYTDHENIRHEPLIFTNYLEANTSLGADTKVNLFEEGDYEVALDYEVQNDKFIDTHGHYRIFFKFSVRNSNCMAFLFDTENGNELNNGSLTENGFRLDLARSRYLDVNVKKEVLKEGADGLTEDIRFNHAAGDGQVYTGEGIYTITVENRYTSQKTQKKIYVGTDPLLKAYIVTGKSISSLNQLVAEGATIDDDGNLIMPVNETVPVETIPVLTEVPTEIPETAAPLENSDYSEEEPMPTQVSSEEPPADIDYTRILVYALPGLLIIILIIIFSIKKHRRKKA